MENWYALRVKPHKERAVTQQLASQNVTYYYPTIRVNPKNPRAAKVKPYFPGYLFLKVDLEKMGQNLFSWMPGTLGLVTFGETPAIVPHDLITTLMQKLEAMDGRMLEPPKFKEGERIRITEGPFAGFEAIFDRHMPGSERVQILLAFLSSHPHPIRLSQDAVEKLSSNR